MSGAAWVWIGAAGAGFVILAVLATTALGLLRRLKDLNRGFQTASGRLNQELDQMRSDLERTSEGLAALRRQGQEEAP